MNIQDSITKLLELDNKGDLAALRRPGSVDGLRVLARHGFAISHDDHARASTVIGYMVSIGIRHDPEKKFGAALQSLSEERAMAVAESRYIQEDLVRAAMQLKGASFDLVGLYWDVYGWGDRERQDRSRRSWIEGYYSSTKGGDDATD